VLFDLMEQLILAGAGKLGRNEVNGVHREPPWFSFSVRRSELNVNA